MVKAILFDFGGVIAEEGFREGLMEIGRKNGLDPEEFFKIATELVYSTGYVMGNADEPDYWKALRQKMGIQGNDRELRNELLGRFAMRPDMIDLARDLKKRGLAVYILSDQTNWLDEINEKYHIFEYFDNVFNSYYLHRSKRDPALFTEVCETIGFQPAEVLFVDDNPTNTDRAEKTGLKTIVYKNHAQFRKALKELI